MNSGHAGRTCEREQNSIHSEVTVKQEDGIKEEPIDNTELVELSRTIPTDGTRDPMGMQIENGTDDQLNIESDFCCVKEEIKSERQKEEESAPKKSCEGENEHANGVEAGNRDNGHQNFDSTNPNNDRKPQKWHGKVKDKGRNRILTKKRNMATASKTRKVRAKPKTIHKCSHCDYTTSYKPNLTTHIRIHTGEKPFECEICAKSFTVKQNLTTHKKTHRSLFKIHCSKCRMGFGKEKDKLNHETECKGRQYECHLCKYSTLHLSALKLHMQFHHTAEKPFECSVCSRTFTTKSDLASHSRVHEKQLPFDCMKCGRRLADKTEKQSHEKRCNRRQYECHICRYNSFYMSHLKCHMRLKHTGDKQFRCGICDKKFVRKSNLNQHLASHAKQRLRCSKCLRRFKDENVKMEHEKRCNRRHYQCYLCKINSQKVTHLKIHMQKHHLDNKMAQN